MIRRIWTIARREVKALFDHPTGYVLLVVFLAINAFMYFRQTYMDGEATLRPMLDLLPWLFLFFVPAVAMRTLAEDARSGVLEVVLTQPVSEFELLLGKFAGAVIFLWIGLLLTVPIPLALTLGATLQWGPIAAQYVGAGLLALGLVGVGVWASSVARSQITAFILGVAVMFVLILFGLNPLIVGLPPTLGTIAAHLGVLSHFQNMGRGVIDLRDAIYFLSLAGIFLALAYGTLLGRKLAPGRAARRRLVIGVGLAVATLVVVNLMGSYINGRLDLTPGRAYTLSPGTRQIVDGLSDVVTIKEFASDALPTQVALTKRDVDDLLRDLRSAARGKIRVEESDPGADTAAANDAERLGIQPVQFNVVGRSSLQVKRGYFGLALQYEGRKQTIPFVSETNDLEYQLATAIQALTLPNKPVIALFDLASGPGVTFQILKAQLDKSYDVRRLTLADTTQPAADVKTAVVVGGPDSVPPPVRARFTELFRRGGSGLFMVNGMHPSAQAPMAYSRPVGWNQVLAPFGISVAQDLAYDLVASEMVPVPSAAGQVLTRYPLFINAHTSGQSVVNREVDNALFPWASTVDTRANTPYVQTPLYVTTAQSGIFTGTTSIIPTRDFPQDSLGIRLLAVQAEPRVTGDSAAARGRVIVVGTSNIVADRIVPNAPQNMDFVLNAVDWLTQDAALISIRSKNRALPKLAFTSDTTRNGVKYFNLILVPLLVGVAGLIALARRRRKTRQPYQPLAAAGGRAPHEHQTTATAGRRAGGGAGCMGPAGADAPPRARPRGAACAAGHRYLGRGHDSDHSARRHGASGARRRPPLAGKRIPGLGRQRAANAVRPPRHEQPPDRHGREPFGTDHARRECGQRTAGARRGRGAHGARLDHGAPDRRLCRPLRAADGGGRGVRHARNLGGVVRAQAGRMARPHDHRPSGRARAARGCGTWAREVFTNTPGQGMDRRAGRRRLRHGRPARQPTESGDGPGVRHAGPVRRGQLRSADGARAGVRHGRNRAGRHLIRFHEGRCLGPGRHRAHRLSGGGLGAGQSGADPAHAHHRRAKDSLAGPARAVPRARRVHGRAGVSV